MADRELNQNDKPVDSALLRELEAVLGAVRSPEANPEQDIIRDAKAQIRARLAVIERLRSQPLSPSEQQALEYAVPRLRELEAALGALFSEEPSPEGDVVGYAKVLSHAVDTFGSRTNANNWLNKPNRVFHNQTPLQILTEDPAAVEEELVRIDHGMFI